jgi:hypothetical protein
MTRRRPDKARLLLRQFLDTLAVVTNVHYEIRRRVLVADWTPGLTKRRFLYYKVFPDPNVPKYGLSQEHMETVATFTANPIPRGVRLAMQWWAHAAASSPPSEQFQRFWYALEILAEHAKPNVKVASKCSTCGGDLYCTKCGTVPLHRPYPKQAIKMLIQKHVTGQPDEFFDRIDEVRNRLLHGEDPKEIARAMNFEWQSLTDDLGRATWAALLSHLMTLTAAHATEPGRVAVVQFNTYAHRELIFVSDMSMGATHADPANPHIDEFRPDFKLTLNVKDREELEAEARAADRRIAGDDEGEAG